MESIGNGTTKNLNDSRMQALQALINSVSPSQGPDESLKEGEKLTPHQVRKLSKKLDEILGEDGTVLGRDSDGAGRNDKGEVVNEDGLPIIDINEPLPTDLPSSSSDPVGSFDDPDLLPFWALSPAERARRKMERERALDLLEEEERIQQERDNAAAREKWKAELERRKEAAKAEMESLKKARDLQRRMGKALVRNVIETQERNEKERLRQEREEQAKLTQKCSGEEAIKRKKSVSFSGIDEETDEESDTENRKGKGKQPLDWGDVAPARLRTKGRTTLLTKAEMEKQPMKMEVIERQPGAARLLQQPQATITGDSDDESMPDSEDYGAHLEESDEEGVSGPPHSSSSGESENEDEGMHDDEPIHWDEDDLDFARDQREIALAYYEKRATIGADVASAMKAHTHDGEENEWDRPEVPLDATLASPPPKPGISRFQASRLANAPSSYLASHSLGPSVLPSSQSSALKSAVRMGKLDNGRLAGGEQGESDDEYDGGDSDVRDIMELLKKGEITNMGPQLVTSSSSGPSQSSTDVERSQSAPEDELEPETKARTPANQSRPKVSKFKMAVSQESSRSSQSLLVSPSLSALNTPVFPEELFTRRHDIAPKNCSPGDTTFEARPILSLAPSSRLPPSSPATVAGKVKERSPLAHPIPIPSSSSRPPSKPSPTVGGQVKERALPSRVMPQGEFPSMVVESPSFLPFDPNSPFQSVLIDPSTGNPIDLPDSSLLLAKPQDEPKPSVVTERRVAERRPPVVMTAEVKESKSFKPGEGARGNEKKERVSRFLAERL